MGHANARLGWLSGWVRAWKWKRKAKRYKARAEKLEARLEAEWLRHQEREEQLLNRVLQAASLSALPNVKRPQPVEAKPEAPVATELSELDELIRNDYREQAKAAGLAPSIGDEWFELFRRGESYEEQ